MVRLAPDFWGRNDPPQTAVQRAAAAIDYAWEEAGESLMAAPDPVEALIQDKIRKARTLLCEVRDHLKELDSQFCDLCGGHWTDDPIHIAHCGPDKYADDEYEHIKDALATGVVYGPTPGPTQGGTDEH